MSRVLDEATANIALDHWVYSERSLQLLRRTFRPHAAKDKMIFFGEDSLRNAIREFVEHYHFERNHQGLDNRLIMASSTTPAKTGTAQARRRLGGMLNYYYRK